jgi:hypothetical protein
MKNKSTERLLLDESRFDGKRKPNYSANGFLLEIEGGFSFIEKCKRNKDLPIHVTGIIQTGDKPNRNGRIYPWDYLKRECLRYAENEINNGTSYGELDHPESSTSPSLQNASHTIEDIWFKGKDVWAKIKILNAFMPDRAPGLMARGFVLNGKSIGISSRALGSLKEDENNQYDVVDEDLEMICWDLVSNASNFGSEKMEMMQENKKYKKTILTESQCFGGNCNISNNVQDLKFKELTESEKTYMRILGVERFLQIKSQHIIS